MNLKFINILSTFFCLISLLSISCSDQSSTTDIISITKVNTYFSESDIRKGVVKTTARMTPVKLSHQRHEDAGVPCISCHLKKNNDSRIKKCAFCHKGRQGVVHLHKVCTNCHKERKIGNQLCKDCHIDEDSNFLNKEIKEKYNAITLYKKNICTMFDKAGIKCNFCHHDSDNIDDRTNIEKKCSECHSGKSRMRIMHIFCKSCHKKERKNNSNKLLPPISCDGCHLQKRE